MLPIIYFLKYLVSSHVAYERIYFLKYLVRSGIRTHAYSCRLRPERSALDHSAILTMSITHIYFYK